MKGVKAHAKCNGHERGNVGSLGTEQHGVGFVGNDDATVGDISVLLYEERVLGEAAWYWQRDRQSISRALISHQS